MWLGDTLKTHILLLKGGVLLSAYDIIEMIHSRYGKDMVTTVEAVNELVELINTVSFQASLISELEMFTDLHNACPKCGVTIEVLSIGEADRGEYFGTPVTEKEYLHKCPNCGYEK